MDISPQQAACQDLLALLNVVKVGALELAEEQGLTRVQFFALYYIDLQGGVAMRQLADVLHCDASNVTGIVDRLVAQELVMRQECPNDRRAKSLQLTPKGRQAISALKAGLPAKLGCDSLSQEECGVLHRIVTKMGK